MHDAASRRYGTSQTVLDYVLKDQIARFRPTSVVDFGAGGGKNGRLDLKQANPPWLYSSVRR
jgi:hypothetical protein